MADTNDFFALIHRGMTKVYSEAKKRLSKCVKMPLCRSALKLRRGIDFTIFKGKENSSWQKNSQTKSESKR